MKIPPYLSQRGGNFWPLSQSLKDFCAPTHRIHSIDEDENIKDIDNDNSFLLQSEGQQLLVALSITEAGYFHLHRDFSDDDDDEYDDDEDNDNDHEHNDDDVGVHPMRGILHFV